MKIFELLSQKNSDNKDNATIIASFLGDSVTQGAFEFVDEKNNEHHIFDYEAVYHTQLKRMIAKMFPKAPFNTINAGILGTSASFGLKRLERDVLHHNPNLVVVCFGLNDSFAGEAGISVYVESLRNMFRKLKERSIETIFMTPNMMNTYVSDDITNEEMLAIAKDTEKTQNSGLFDKYIDNAKSVCLVEGIKICDCYEKWKLMHKNGIDTTKLLANRINHPDKEMHKLFAEELFKTISE